MDSTDLLEIEKIVCGLIFQNGIFTSASLNGPQRDKTCLLGFRESEVQTSLYSYRDYLEN